MADEVELKLELTPEAATVVAGSSVLPANSTVAKQISIYFDTPSQALRKAGLTLRIRQSKGKRIQTVKAVGTSIAGLFARSEWERPVKDNVPVLDDTTPIPALIGAASNEIAPLFEVHVERRTWIVEHGNAVIEVVLDRGNANANGRTSSICEMELELKEGSTDALFALARQIDDIIPARLGMLTKSERGYRLTRPPVTVFKAETVKLDPDVTAAGAFQHIIQTCIRQYRLNETVLIEERNPEALHQARVALRRLRSAFSIFKPLLAKDADAGLPDNLRFLASEFGDARNLDVLLERSTPGPLHDRLQAARDNAYLRVEAALASPRVRTLMMDLAQWTSTGAWLRDPDHEKFRDLPAREFASKALGRLRRVKKDGRDLVKADDELRHELRKDAKKLRYAAEFFGTLFDDKRQKRRAKRFVTALGELQDQLGLLNDLATAPDVLQALNVADDPEADALLAKGNRKKLLRAAADAHELLADTKPFWR